MSSGLLLQAWNHCTPFGAGRALSLWGFVVFVANISRPPELLSPRSGSNLATSSPKWRYRAKNNTYLHFEFANLTNKSKIWRLFPAPCNHHRKRIGGKRLLPQGAERACPGRFIRVNGNVAGAVPRSVGGFPCYYHNTLRHNIIEIIIFWGQFSWRIPLRSFCAGFVLEKCGRKKDNGYDLNEACKGCVFLASEKFNPVRECGPGFRKNLIFA